MAGRYGGLEYAYPAPIAEALATHPGFRSWFLKCTRFAAESEARLLNDEMSAARSKIAENWWRSHWRGGCACKGCQGGQETDLLAIFETTSGSRLALHCEIKQPKDSFPKTKDQAANYTARAQCWIDNPPAKVLRHDDADTVLICSESRLGAYAGHTKKFGSVITFEQITRDFTDIGEQIGSGG